MLLMREISAHLHKYIRHLETAFILEHPKRQTNLRKEVKELVYVLSKDGSAYNADGKAWDENTSIMV